MPPTDLDFPEPARLHLLDVMLSANQRIADAQSYRHEAADFQGPMESWPNEWVDRVFELGWSVAAIEQLHSTDTDSNTMTLPGHLIDPLLRAAVIHANRLHLRLKSAREFVGRFSCIEEQNAWSESVLLQRFDLLVIQNGLETEFTDVDQGNLAMDALRSELEEVDELLDELADVICVIAETHWIDNLISCLPANQLLPRPWWLSEQIHAVGQEIQAAAKASNANLVERQRDQTLEDLSVSLAEPKPDQQKAGVFDSSETPENEVVCRKFERIDGDQIRLVRFGILRESYFELGYERLMEIDYANLDDDLELVVTLRLTGYPKDEEQQTWRLSCGSLVLDFIWQSQITGKHGVRLLKTITAKELRLAWKADSNQFFPLTVRRIA